MLGQNVPKNEEETNWIAVVPDMDTLKWKEE